MSQERTELLNTVGRGAKNKKACKAVQKATVVQVNQEVEVAEEVSSDDRMSDISYHKNPPKGTP